VQWANADCRLTDLTPQNHTWTNVVNIDATANPPTVSVTNATPLWNQYYAGLANKCLPAETVRPSVTGTSQAGGLLSSVPGSWLDRLSNQFAYQWRRCDATGWACADIPGATAQNYVSTPADVGHALRARVTGTFIGSTEQGTPQDSSATSAVTPAPAASQPHVVSLTAALKLVRRVRVSTLARHGLRVRVHCSLACGVRLDLTGRGGVKLAHRTTSFRKAGSRTLSLRLGKKARRIVRRFHSGTLTLRLRVRSRDGQRQTVTRTLHLKR
jgi:hypothetical protein